MTIRTIWVEKFDKEWRALIEWTTGFLWWKHTHRRELVSESGIVWEWATGTPGSFYGRSDPDLESIVRRLERNGLRRWEQNSPLAKSQRFGTPTVF